MHGIYNISQSAYIKEIIADFSLSDAKSLVSMNYKKLVIENEKKKINEFDILPDTTKYRRLLGRLLYASVISRPNIFASVNILAQRVNKPVKLE